MDELNASNRENVQKTSLPLELQGLLLPVQNLSVTANVDLTFKTVTGHVDLT